MAQTANETELLKVLSDYIRLSEPFTCTNCGKTSRLIGEPRINGNWWCPFCFTYYPYKETPDIQIEVPLVKLTNQLETAPKGVVLEPLGTPSTVFPMDLTTGFLVPSYSTKIRRKRNVLLAQAIDFTRYGRIKSESIWQFDLVFNKRMIAEFEVLISFADTQGYHLPFVYTDPIRHSTHTAFFDSDVEGDEVDFNVMDFSVRISE